MTIRSTRLATLTGCLLAAVILLALPVWPTAAAPTAAQRSQVEALRGVIVKAGQLYTAGKYQESADLVKQVQGKCDELVAEGNADMIGLLGSIYESLGKAHALLELEGMKLPPLKKPEVPAGATPTTPGTPTTPANNNGGVSFVTSVAPILNGRCGGCHVRQARGDFSMSNYAMLMAGPAAGKVVFPGDPIGSRLIEVIESGDMPRGGGRVSAEDLGMLKKWISEGAKFDGPDPQAGLASLNGGTTPTPPMRVEATAATGNEKVSFSRDLAGVIAENCRGCHGTNRPRNNLSVVSVQSLLRGGDAGAPVIPGKPKESLLIQKLKGTADGARMPMGRPALSDEVIAKFETWIGEGAKYDGPNPTMDVETLAAMAFAVGATHEELKARRVELAEQNWRLGLPDSKSSKFETDNFLVVGNTTENLLEEIGNTAETVKGKVATMFNAPADKPLMKGRMTLFAMTQRYDYAEFGQMVEKRQLPGGIVGHWQYTVIDAYGAIIPPPGDQYPLDSLVGQQVAGTYVASLHPSVPRWFAEGAARVAAGKINARDPRVEMWKNSVGAIAGGMSKADDFLTGKLPPEESDILAYSFVDYLMGNSRGFNQLLGALRGGAEFDKAFAAVYRGTPAQAAMGWATRRR